MQTMKVCELPATELKVRKKDPEQMVHVLQELPHELMPSDCLLLLLFHFSMVLWPHFLHPIKIYYLDYCLRLHYYSCHNSGWFKNSHRRSFPYLPPSDLNVISASLVLPSCFGPGNHHSCLGYWNSILLCSLDFTLSSPYTRHLELLFQNGKGITLLLRAF